MEQFSLSIPAYLYDFSQRDDGRTIAKLKAFYVGETADGRIVDEDCAKCLAESIPYTPVVAFYSDLKDDFIGHNNTQYIYGLVRPDAEYGFETDEEGVKWFTTEVMLYTDREDNIGEIAKKIVGKAQSLEMQRDSVEYEIFKEEGRTKIRFKKAKFAGLSVLGDEQKPAFTGSTFFTEDEDIKARFEVFFSCLNNRGVSMDKKEQFEQLLDFMKLNYNEKMRMVGDYAQTQFGDSKYVLVAEMNDTDCVLEVIDMATYETDFVKYDYAIDEQGVSLSNERKAYRRYLSIQEIEKLDSSQPEQSPEVKQEVNTNASEEGATKDEQTQVSAEEEPNPTALTDSEREEFESLRGKKEELEQLNEQYNKELETAKAQFIELQQTNESKVEEFNTLVESLNAQIKTQQEELEKFRLAEKETLVNSYKETFDEAKLNEFSEIAKTISYEELESKLALEFVKVAKNQNTSKNIPFSFKSLYEVEDKSTEKKDSYASAVRSVLNK